MKIPVYKGLLETKTTMGVPTSIIFSLVGLLVLLFIIVRSLLVIIPVAIIFSILKIFSRKDPKFLELYINNIFSKDHLIS